MTLPIAGHTLIKAKSREEALAWARRFPNPSTDGGQSEIEVRQLYEPEDFGPSAGIERMREIGMWREHVIGAPKGIESSNAGIDREGG